MRVHTIGHYNHSKETFISLLQAKKLDYVVDVRSMPGSSRSPQFNEKELEKWLKDVAILYAHFPKLGGRRSRSGEVGEALNVGWNNRSFHNYADYTLTEGFIRGINELKQLTENHRVVLMCSERHPSRCHRLIISNHLQVNGDHVTHIIPNEKGEPSFVDHELGKWGATPVVEKDGTVVYPVI